MISDFTSGFSAIEGFQIRKEDAVGDAPFRTVTPADEENRAGAGCPLHSAERTGIPYEIPRQPRKEFLIATQMCPGSGTVTGTRNRHADASPEGAPEQPAAHIRLRTTSAADVPRARGAFPFVGHAWSLARKPLDFLAAVAEQGDVVEVRLGRTPVYVISNQELARQMVDVNVFSQGMFADLLKPVFGTSVETTSGAEHRWYRQRALPAFGRAMQTISTRVMWQETVAITKAWQPGQNIDVCEMADDLAARIIAKCIFSARVGDEVAAAVRKTLPILAEVISLRNPRPMWWLGRVPLPGDRAAAKAAQELRAAVHTAIKLHQQHGSDGEDMLSAILAASQAHGEALSDLQLLDLMVDLVAAGANNSGKTIAWALYELDANPTMAEQVYKEINEFMAHGAPNQDSVPNLAYLGEVITETLRKYGNVAITRRTERPVTLGGVQVPAGAHVLVSPHIIGRDPRYFTDPDRFDPNRWQSGDNSTKHAFIPFGLGVHRCMGDRFAMSEITIALVAICARWKLHLRSGYRVQRRAVVSVRPDSLHMTAELRNCPHP